MSMRQISKSLQMKSLKYLEYIKHKDDQQPLRGQDIVYHLSDDLQKQIKRDFYGTILNHYKILNFNFSQQCLSDLALRMQECYYGPGEIIYTQNNLDDRIFFVAKGRVELYTETNTQQYTYEILQVKDYIKIKYITTKNSFYLIKLISIQITFQDIHLFKKGDAFGKEQFFGQPLVATSAKSISFSLIVYCSQQDFKDILMNYPEDYEKFCMMRDNLTVNSKPFQNSCFICKKLYHTISNCPLMHNVRKKEFIVLRYIHSVPMERQINNRKRQDKFSTLKEIKLVKKDLKKFRLTLIKNVKEKKLNHKINSYSSTSSSSVLSSLSSDENEKKGKPHRSSWDSDDKQFYQKNPKIVCIDGSLQIDSAYSDISSDSMTLSEYNNYFLNLDQMDQIIKINGVETIQEEKSLQYNDDDQSQPGSKSRGKSSSRPLIQFSNFDQSPPRVKDDYQIGQMAQEQIINDEKTEQFQLSNTNLSSGSNEINSMQRSSQQKISNIIIDNNQSNTENNIQFESPTNIKKSNDQVEQSPSNMIKGFEKKDTLYHLQQQYLLQQQQEQKQQQKQQQSDSDEKQHNDTSYNRQTSHKEPLLQSFNGSSSSPSSQKNIFNKQLSVKNVNNPSKFYQKEQSLKQQNVQIPLSHIPVNQQSSSQFTLTTLNEIQLSPFHKNGTDNSKFLSPSNRNNSTIAYLSNRPISSAQNKQNNDPYTAGLIPSISSTSGEGFIQSENKRNSISVAHNNYHHQNQYQIQLKQRQQLNSNIHNNQFGVGIYQFHKPFLERPAKINIKKQTMISDFASGTQNEFEQIQIKPFINPIIAQIKKTEQNRRDSHMSSNFNNTSVLNSSRRGTVGAYSSNLNQTHNLSRRVIDTSNNNNDETNTYPSPYVKSIQMLSHKNSGSMHMFGPNSLMIPGTPLSAVELHPHMSMKKDFSLLMQNVSPMNDINTPKQSNIPRHGSTSEDNINMIYDYLQFIPLELDILKEYKKYFPEGNFSAQFKEKIKIMKLLSRKLSNPNKETSNLKKIIQKKLSKINSMSQKRSFLKQNSKFSSQSFQNNLNILEHRQIKSQNLTPNISMNGIT